MDEKASCPGWTPPLALWQLAPILHPLSLYKNSHHLDEQILVFDIQHDAV